METENVDMEDVTEEESSARLVHFDLKGAAPKLDYYEKIFPLLKRWGATGLLVEYEDTFPYEEELQDIAADHAYSKDEIRKILAAAKENDLSVIPLVQSFGHFEFVLKHDKFKHLREVPNYPMTLCPMKEESLTIVCKMVDQVMKLHPNIKAFHIGADEVFHLGFCKACKQAMADNQMNETNFFLRHVKKLLQALREKYPDVKLIMWDDMFRGAETQSLIDSGVGDIAEVMVWYYQRNFQLPDDIWDRYSKAFSSIWIASAFKGATGPCMFVTDIGYHVENHKAWIEVLQKHSHKFKHYRGCCITGWTRYDHYAILCELLPVSLPSVALCMLTLTNGAFTAEVHKLASIDLNFTDLIPLSPFLQVGFLPQCNFPGHEIYIGCLVLYQLQEEYDSLTRSDRLHGWMTEYHIKRNFTNPAHINNILPQALKLLDDYRRLKMMLQPALDATFRGDTSTEWMSYRIDPMIQELERLVENAKNQITLGGRPKENLVIEEINSEAEPSSS